MTTSIVIKNILINNLQSINRLHQSLSLYINLGIFTKLSTNHFQTLNKLNKQIIPTHLQTASHLFHTYKIQPPLPFCGIHKPAIIGLLTHFSFTEKYSQFGLKKQFIKCSEDLNDSIRQLNENDLQQKQLRGFLISCRNDLDSKMIIFSEVRDQNNIISKSIDWLL